MPQSPKWPDVRWLPFGVLSIAALGLILWLGRDLTFTWDECDFTARGWDVLRPHNEHWSTIPLLTWKTTMAMFGTASYLPFHAVLLGAYLLMAAGVYALLGGLFAVGAVALLLFLGTGSDQLMSAFQIMFVESSAAGVWALYFIERGRHARAAVLLIVAVASSGMGLAFLAAGMVLGALRRDRAAAWLALPVVVYGVWYVAFNSGGDVELLRVPGFVAEQLLGASAALMGLPGIVVLLVVVGVAAWRGRDPLIFACLVGIVAEFAIIGLVRDEGSARYQTTFAALALVGVGRIRWPRHRYLTVFGALVFGWALLVNFGWLLAYPYEFAIWVTQPGRLC